MQEDTSVLDRILPLFGQPEKYGEIESALMDHSNLPGPRGNLTLAYRFAECFSKTGIRSELLDLLTGWVNLSYEEAPTSSPEEYLPFCGILALGAHFCHAEGETRNRILRQFKTAMNDRRWRTREAAAMGFQLIAEKDFSMIESYFTEWYPDATLLEKRTFIAALAHPPILDQEDAALFSLDLSDRILKDVLSSDPEVRRSEDFKTLSKGLQYAVSVFAAWQPEEGFALFKKYAGYQDPEMKKIILANLGKARLTKNYGPMVEEVRRLYD